MKRERNRLLSHLGRLLSKELDYPIDAMMDVAGIHITGGDAVLIEGCKGVLFYSDAKLSLDMGRFSLTFHGVGLVLEDLSKSNLSLTGQLTAILFDKKEDSAQ